MSTDLLPTPPVAALRASVVGFMALAAALGTASTYLLQPAIADVGESLHSSTTQVGSALAGGPVGYLLGLVLLVPLVDRFSPKFVLPAQFCALAIALALTAAVGSAWLLGLLVGLVGAGAAVGAQLSSIAGRFAVPQRRAAVLGVVTAGISAGILAGRIGGGWLTDQIGWRGMLLVFAAACAVVAVVARVILPVATGSAKSGYLATLRSLPQLYLRFPILRLAAWRGALWFFAFCAVWAGIAVALSQAPFSYSPERIGGYGVAGLLGVVATRIAGTWTDRVGARRVILVGLMLATSSAVVLGICLSNTAVTMVCLGLFDAGLFAAQVANQSTVLAIDPAAPARFNSAYMLIYFVGGSLGTAFGPAAVEWFGWPTTAAVTAVAIIAAMAVTLSVGLRGGCRVARSGCAVFTALRKVLIVR